MNPGDIVKFKNPLTPQDSLEQFKVLEIRGDKALVEAICDMKFKPTFVYFTASLIRLEVVKS